MCFHFSVFEWIDDEDIIDETLNFFRANVFFRNFDVKGKADRTMIYLTLYTHYLLVKAEKIDDRAAGTPTYPPTLNLNLHMELSIIS